jgi:broad specificity phosphatase PhoE
MIVLIRHGETEGNRQRVLQLAETPLNAQGIAQAERLAQRIAQRQVGLILCSDLPRAQMTAAPLVARLRVPIEYTPLLQERNFGALRGTPYAALDTDPFAPDFHPPEGESWAVFHARVAQAFALVVQKRRQSEGELVVVTHGLVLRVLLAQHALLAEGMQVPGYFDHTSVSLLAAEPPHGASLINCAAHVTEAALARGAPV